MSEWKTREEYAEMVLHYVNGRDWVTFADLHKRFAGDAREETEISLPGNRVVWTGLPAALIDAILGLLESGQLAAVPIHKSAYIKDGRVLKLPVEKFLPPEGHAEPHWYPVCLRPMQTLLEEAEDA